MTDFITRKLFSTATKALYALAVFCFLSHSPAVAQTAASPTSPSATPAPPAFEVSVVKETGEKNGRWRLSTTYNGWNGLDVSVLQMIQEAYAFQDTENISGITPWMESKKYDFTAKINDSDLTAFKKLSYDQQRIMLQNLLAERFHLKVHYSTKDAPIYLLVPVKSGAKLQPTVSTFKWREGMGGSIRHSEPHLVVSAGTMPYLAKTLSRVVGRLVVDQTGLTGRYDYELNWDPDYASAQNTSELVGQSVFTALQKQLGLKLAPSHGPVPVLVIDHVETPTPN